MVLEVMSKPHESGINLPRALKNRENVISIMCSIDITSQKVMLKLAAFDTTL